MKSFVILFFLLLMPVHHSIAKTNPPAKMANSSGKKNNTKKLDSRKLYQEMKLNNKISYPAFSQAIAGYNKLNAKNKDIITLIDFTKPSTEKRLFVIDVKRKKVITSSVVSHGVNSGDNFATSFSNQNGSHKSSLGFFLTENTYQGKNGYSLVLNGLEQGINDNAKQRAIVIHGANYANPNVIQSNGRLGRSFGCPALPRSVNKQIIDLIKDGSLLYIHGNDANYRKQSTLIPKNAV